MLHQRASAKYRIHSGPRGGAINGMVYALPLAAALWAVIAGIIFRMI